MFHLKWGLSRDAGWPWPTAYWQEKGNPAKNKIIGLKVWVGKEKCSVFCKKM